MKLLYLLIFVFVSPFVISQSVTLDATFGTGGKVVHSFASETDGLIGVRIQTDGKILAAGMKQFDLNGNTFITRFNSDGNIDTDFGVEGLIMTPLINETGSYSMMMLQADGKILITGSFSSSNNIDTFNYATQRYNVDGSLDTTFGTNGTVVTDFNGSGDIGRSVSVQTDGKIVVAGYTRVGFKFRASLVRYLFNGGLDLSFGINGKLVLPAMAANSSEFLEDIKILSNNKIALGLVTDALETIDGLENFGLAMVNSNGTLDTNFGGTGMIVADLYGIERLWSICESNDAIIVIGNSQGEQAQRFMLARYLPDGLPDVTFGDNGLVLIPASMDFPCAIPTYAEVLDGGKILAAGLGVTSAATMVDFTLVQFNSDGTLDTGFNQTGFILTDFNLSDDWAGSFAIQPNGSIVCVGSTVVNSESDAALLRYNLTSLTAADFKADLVFSISPNPFTNKIILSLNLDQSETLSADLFDCDGRKIQNLLQDISFPFGKNTIEIQMPESLANGIYFVSVFNGTTNTTLKIIK